MNPCIPEKKGHGDEKEEDVEGLGEGQRVDGVGAHILHVNKADVINKKKNTYPKAADLCCFF